ncbi:MAG: hypothetical protein KAR38_07725 [Calditrichia bacterium]|nr:hypothetical protein [Calditrichia bacterium]
MIRRIIIFLFMIVLIFIVKELFWKKTKKKNYSILGKQKNKKNKNISNDDVIEINYKEIKKESK